MLDAKSSIAQLEKLIEFDDSIKNLLRRRLAKSHLDFLEIVYDDLVLSIQRLEANPQPFDAESEDATTQRLIDVLWAFGYVAHHNAQSGGNVDITIELPSRNFKWIGEAKKFDSVSDMRAGYLQLSTRYRSGMDADGTMHGGLIGYLRRRNAAKCMQDWQEKFAEMPEVKGYQIDVCNRRKNIAFYTTHAHQDFGTPLKVWHSCIVLYFQPQDASGLSAKKYKKPIAP